MLPFGSPYGNNAFATGLGAQQMPLPGAMPSNAGMFPMIPQLHLQGMNQNGMPQTQPSAIQGLAPITYSDSLLNMMPWSGPAYGTLPQTQMGYGGMPPIGMLPMQGQNPMLTNPLAYMQGTGYVPPTFGGFNPFAPPPLGTPSNASAITRQGTAQANPFTAYNMSVPGAGAAAAQPAPQQAAASASGGSDQGAVWQSTGGAEGGGVGGGADHAGGEQAEAAGGGSNDLGGMY